MQSTHLFLAVLFDGQLLLDPDGGPLPSQPGLFVHVHRHSRNSQVWHPRMGFAIVLYYSMDYCKSHLRRCVVSPFDILLLILKFRHAIFRFINTPFSN
ncbi:hypothetical protein TNCT_675721 [Trichonephila clavata]|uniref:Secreted protein n=1 Tax=Trichonephila clavata TaxID=2740835 RepID=A0A8X6LUV8_TRICU|nr:hypothetical protein TNCT_675721 [Trichonephila clavata]